MQAGGAAQRTVCDREVDAKLLPHLSALEDKVREYRAFAACTTRDPSQALPLPLALQPVAMPDAATSQLGAGAHGGVFVGYTPAAEPGARFRRAIKVC